MKKLLIAGSLLILSGCSTIKTVDDALNKAAVLATGDCAKAVHAAVATCNK